MKVINILDKLYETINKSIEQYKLASAEVYVWGLSRASYAGVQYYAHKGVWIRNIIDNDVNVVGELSKKYYGYCEWGEGYRPKVIYGKELGIEEIHEAYFLVFSRFYDDIKKQLLSYGADSEKIILIYDAREELLAANELIDDGKPKKRLSLPEIKVIELDILHNFVKICNENGLRYYLAAGTLLGAIRHKGFIPWDDDIDVYMPVPDYYRLVSLAKDYNTSGTRYQLLYHNVVDDYSWRFMKMSRTDTVAYTIRWPLICAVGVNIDIFPVSGCPADVDEMNMYYAEVLTVLADWYKVFVKLGHSTANNGEWADRIEKVISRYQYDSAPCVGMLLDGEPGKEIISGDGGRNFIDVLFEGEMFKGIKGYDEYLRASYGNYMTPPPQALREVGSHELKAYLIGGE